MAHSILNICRAIAGKPRPILFALALGALMVPGYAPFYQFLLPVVLLAMLFRLWVHAGSRRFAAIIGFAFGMGFFATGVSWVYVSMHDFGAMPAPLAVVATMLLCAFLALFPATVGLFVARSKLSVSLKYSLLLPALWVASEWIRGWLFTGFPWLTLGYSQAPDSPLAGYAPLVGVYGVSLVAAISAGMFALIYEHRRMLLQRQGFWVLGLLALWGAGLALKQEAWTQPVGAPVTVSLLQGNIAQDLKWREDRVISTLALYRDLALASRSRLIILPETALPLFYDNVPATYLDSLAAHARSQGGDIMIGIPEQPGGGNEYYNSVLSFGTAPTQTYRKYHLVPFGEYIPFKPLLGWVIDVLHIPLSDFARGATPQPPLQVAGQKVAVNICYEDVFGEEIIRPLPQATLLVNVSNDAWFGESIAPMQHLQIAQMRALETGRYMLRATNTGVTAIIDQRGQVLSRVPAFQVVALNGNVQGFSGSTPYVRFGNSAVLALLVLMLATAFVLHRVHVKRG